MSFVWPVSVVAHGASSPRLLKHLIDIGLGGFALSGLRDFAPVLAFSFGVLAVGWLFRWPAGHLPLPILAWAYRMARELQNIEWNLEPESSPAVVAVYLLEGSVTLFAVLAIVAVAAVARRPSAADRFTGLCWVSALVAVGTVLLDALFVMLFLL